MFNKYIEATERLDITPNASSVAIDLDTIATGSGTNYSFDGTTFLIKDTGDFIISGNQTTRRIAIEANQLHH